MKVLLMAGALSLGLMTSGQSVAQTATIEIAPDQRTVIREYVVKEKLKPARIETQVKVGASLPTAVELRPVPPAWGPKLTRYRYSYVGERVVLVEPDTREVVYIID